jgi:chitinase
VSQAVQGYLAGGVPRPKLVIGVPFYGRGWKDVPGTNRGLYRTVPGATPADRAAPGTFQAGFEDFKVLNQLRQTGGFNRYFNTTTKNAWLYNPASDIFWTYDDPPTMQAKAAYVKSERLGGIMFWELSGDTSAATLVKTIYSALR